MTNIEVKGVEFEIEFAIDAASPMDGVMHHSYELLSAVCVRTRKEVRHVDRFMDMHSDIIHEAIRDHVVTWNEYMAEGDR